VPQDSKSKKASWPADKVERRKVKDLVPYAKNARVHSEEQIEQIAHANDCHEARNCSRRRNQQS
jgi:hypothetical protein